MTWRDGTVYEGHFNDAKFEGYGEMTYPDGSYYKGYWEDGLKHGKNGVMYDATTQKTTKGTFVKDEFQDVVLKDPSPWKNMRAVTKFKKLSGKSY